MTMLDAPRFGAAAWASPGSNWFLHDGASGPVASEREITLDADQTTFREYRIETGLNSDHGVLGHSMVRTFIDVPGLLEDDVIR